MLISFSRLSGFMKFGPGYTGFSMDSGFCLPSNKHLTFEQTSCLADEEPFGRALSKSR